MTRLSDKEAYAVAALAGVLLWIGTSAIGGRREAWDAPLYWTAAYPAAIVIACALGFLAPHRPWRYALTIMLTQAITLAFSGSGFGLLPIGLILFAVLAVPPIAGAWLGAFVRQRLYGT